MPSMSKLRLIVSGEGAVKSGDEYGMPSLFRKLMPYCSQYTSGTRCLAALGELAGTLIALRYDRKVEWCRQSWRKFRTISSVRIVGEIVLLFSATTNEA